MVSTSPSPSPVTSSTPVTAQANRCRRKSNRAPCTIDHAASGRKDSPSRRRWAPGGAQGAVVDVGVVGVGVVPGGVVVTGDVVCELVVSSLGGTTTTQALASNT